VRVEHALRPPGRAARVAHGRGRVLVEVRELERRVASGDELLVVERVLALARAVRHHDLALGALEAGHSAGQRGVHEDEPVVGVGRDVAQVLLEQAHVQGVEDGAHRGDRQIQLEVAQGIPREAGDAVAGLDAELGECAGQPPRPLDDLGVR
jgi:hypothetical protein